MTHWTSGEEIVVVGGGPAGAAGACLLARAGRSTLLIERSTAPDHKVCGEFLSSEAQSYLAHLGLDLDRLGAVPIGSVRLVHGRTVAETALPFIGRGLSRKILDEALLQQAVASGARLARGVVVRNVLSGGPHVVLNGGGADEVSARALFLATGKHDVRGVKRPGSCGRDDLIGFKMHFALAPAQRAALEGAVEIVLLPDGYAGLQMIEGGLANICLLAARESFRRTGGRWESLLQDICEASPHLSDRLGGAVAAFSRPRAIYRIPYGFVHAPRRDAAENLFRLGDQAGVIPSFAGDGISIALHSACLAASTYLGRGPRSSDYHRQLGNDIRNPVRIASLVHALSGWHATRSALVGLFRFWPATMRQVAALTRLPEPPPRSALRW